MHTTEYDIKGYKDVRIHHNGGWDGEVIVCWQEHGSKKRHEVKLPSEILLALSRDAAVAIIRTKVEDVLDQI